MIPEDVDSFGRRALITAAPFVRIGDEVHTIDGQGLEVGAEVAVVDDGQPDGDVFVVPRGEHSRAMHRLDRDCLTLVSVPMAPPAPIDPEVAAHVLWHYRQIGYPPGSFVSALIRTIAGADQGNRRLLARGFPAYVRAVELATEDVNGIDRLRRVMETRRPL